MLIQIECDYKKNFVEITDLTSKILVETTKPLLIGTTYIQVQLLMVTVIREELHHESVDGAVVAVPLR